MGVIIKYVVKFPDPGGFAVSNDVMAGDFIVDADIHAVMAHGSAGGSFRIALYDLPEAQARALRDIQKQQEGAPKVEILLGYFDDPFAPVMEGVFTDLDSKVDGDKLVTTLKGWESGTHALVTTDFQGSMTGTVDIGTVVTQLLKNVPAGELGQSPQLQDISGNLQDPAFRSEKLMGILDHLTAKFEAELLVSDKKVRIGKPIRDDDYAATFDRDVNLAVFQPFSKKIPDEADQNILNPLPADQAVGFRFTVAGDPKLRPAQKVVPKVDKFDQSSGREFRVRYLAHHLSVSGGYFCEGMALQAGADGNLRRRADAVGDRTASAVAQSLTQRIQDESKRRPWIEVGAVKTYSANDNTATLYFGQKYVDRQGSTEIQPSIRTEVESNEQQVLQNKPILSPFAWNKCGLVVPVYPGMKALLTHNLDLADDALVAGFIWSTKPKIETPKNNAGDWWLCLPIDFDASNPPGDSTKAVNDLTANNGKRVIEVKGLKITIGADKLGNVGARPAEGADDEFLIQHKKASIKISADGSLEILADSAAGKGKLTIASSGDIQMTATGGVTLKVGQSAVEIS